MADLHTERLTLRPATADDFPWILSHINTPAVMRHLGGEARSEAAVAESLAEDIAAFGTPEGHRRWTVWLRDPARRVGRVGLFYVRSQSAPATLRGQPEIGWMQAEEDCGNGYATEAARAVLQFGFGTLGFPVIWSQTSDSNTASTRMMRRLGFTPRLELGYEDADYPPEDNPTTVWSIAAEDWKADG